jgi:competence protein ComGC
MEEIRKEENGVTGSMVLITIFSIALVLLLLIPNIYLDNEIYYESRQISYLQALKITFQEEQVLIKNRLEQIHSKENLLTQDVK